MNAASGRCSLILVLACVLAGCGAERATQASTVAETLGSGVILANTDRAIRPQDDFFRFVNGGWLARTEIPADRSNYGAFSLLEEGAESDLRTILEEAAAGGHPPGSDEQKIGDYYASFMDEAGIEARGLEPLAAELERIDAIASTKDLAAYLGHNQRIGVAEPFAFFVAIDEKNSSAYAAYLWQTGLGMPDRDYYLSDEQRMKDVRAKYATYVADLLAAAGTQDATGAARRIVALETRLAKAHWTRVENRDAEKTYNRHEREQLDALMPAFDWQAFFAAAEVPAPAAVVVSQPSYFAELGKAVGDVPLAEWRTFLRFKLLHAYAPYLPQRFAQLHFDFTQRTVSGIEEMKPRWKRGVAAVESAIGELVGRVYVERHFKPEAKERMDRLVANLKAAFAEGIDELEWMTPATKAKAQEKLARFTTKIGYPEKWRDWSRLEVRRDDLVGNRMRALAVSFDRDVAKLGRPVDTTEWLMTPQTVNAYYYPPANEIVFPAAILQPPFFDVTADDAVNYGAIGSVIGHEISHGFDDQGRRYDGEGNLNDWWMPEDNEEFMRRARALGAQYSALEPFPGLHVNGDLTMGENIADLAGVAMAYKAWRRSLEGREPPVIDGFTGEQRFFIGWAQAWARKYREDELRKRLLTDPHSPSEYRTNVVLSNLPEFHAAFDVKPGDGMYRPEEERVKVW